MIDTLFIINDGSARDEIRSAASESGQEIMSDEPRKSVYHFWILASWQVGHFSPLFVFTNTLVVLI